MQLVRGTLMYQLWASTYFLFFKKVPTETTSCAVWKRLLLIPLLWPAGLVVWGFVAIIGILAVGIYLGLMIGNAFIGRRPIGWREVLGKKVLDLDFTRYNGWKLGRFELYPWHTVIALFLVWSIKAIPIAIHYTSSKKQGSDPTPFMFMCGVTYILWVIILAATFIYGIALLWLRSQGTFKPWWRSLKDRFCAKVSIVDHS